MNVIGEISGDGHWNSCEMCGGRISLSVKFDVREWGFDHHEPYEVEQNLGDGKTNLVGLDSFYFDMVGEGWTIILKCKCGEHRYSPSKTMNSHWRLVAERHAMIVKKKRSKKITNRKAKRKGK